MFGFLTSPDKEMRANARNWLHMAERVYNYRRDQLSAATLADLKTAMETLRANIRDKAGGAMLKLSIEALEPVLKHAGGRIYPNSGMRETIEFLVTAAIFILAMRQFVFQPFKIPTNSMWPTYNGMVPEVHATPADEPGAGAKIFRALAFGASAHRVDAPADGEIMIALAGNGLLATPSKGRQWLVFPEEQQRYYLTVGGQTVSVSVPVDFRSAMGWTLKDFFDPKAADFADMFQRAYHSGRLARGNVTLEDGRAVVTTMLRTGKHVKAGERVLSFDIITGDQLFVDRMSYHFVRPRVGSGFVFRTTNIPGAIGEGGRHIDSYYIKRLVGVPGDTLQVKAPALHRNGAPITGAQAFMDNCERAGKYRGYTNEPRDRGFRYLVSPGETYTISKDGYFAMGDNSGDSQDSRYWGEVPKKDAVGRPLWVFYPFASHWGPAK